MDVYLDAARYHKLAEALAAIDANASPHGPLEQVKTVLGEVGDIWPTSIRPSIERGVALKLVR